MRGRPESLLSVRRSFWRLIVSGASTGVAAEAVGVSERVGDRWFSQAGGMSPISLDEPSSRSLSLFEREEIMLGQARGEAPSEIARRLGRHRSTVGREIARNSARKYPRGYRAVLAQAKAEDRARRPKTSRLATEGALRDYVQDKLTCRQHWSPEQISRRLVRDFPHDEGMRISHEAIYQSLYVQGRGALRRELTACLRTGRAVRKPRRRADGRRERIKDKVMISERPAEVADRAVAGDWEGDLIIGKDSASAIGTLVERQTRFVMLLHLPVDHGAVAVRDAITTVIMTLPETLRRSLTWDQGIELSEHLQLKLDTNLAVYFCDPHSPWQRGSNENTNGLLRQYYPKGTNLSVHDAAHIAAVADALNGRPRKSLDWATPAEAMAALLSTPTEPIVATTT
jgi:transposase, IS30 family